MSTRSLSCVVCLPSSNRGAAPVDEGSMGADQDSALGLFLRRCTLAFEALPFEVWHASSHPHPHKRIPAIS